VLYSSNTFRDSKINSFGIFLALLSGNRSTQNLIESCPKLLSMFVCKFEKVKVASILRLLVIGGVLHMTLSCQQNSMQ